MLHMPWKISTTRIVFGISAFLVFFAIEPRQIRGADTSSEERDAEGEAMSEMKYDESMADEEMGGHMSGEVVSVDTERKRFVLVQGDDPDGLIVFSVKDSTTFTNTASLADLEKGDRATVDYYSAGDSRIAENIVVEDRTAEKEEAPPAPPEKVLRD